MKTINILQSEAFILALQPQDIADNFTLVQIEARITSLLTAIENAEQSAQDQFSDTQASQNVKRQSLTALNDTLGIWLKAKSILTGSENSSADLISAKYNPGYPNI